MAAARDYEDLITPAKACESETALRNAALAASELMRSTLPQLKTAAAALQAVQGAWGSSHRAEKLANMAAQVQRDIASSIIAGDQLIDEPLRRAARLDLAVATRVVAGPLSEPMEAGSGHPLNMAMHPLNQGVPVDNDDDDATPVTPVVDGVVVVCEPCEEPTETVTPAKTVTRDKHFSCGICCSPTWRDQATSFAATCCGVEYCGGCWSRMLGEALVSHDLLLCPTAACRAQTARPAHARASNAESSRALLARLRTLEAVPTTQIGKLQDELELQARPDARRCPQCRAVTIGSSAHPVA